MDSLTQLALGAAVGTAVLGRRLGPRRAALVGAVLGTLPDLDVLVPFDDPVDSFVLHRAATHSLIVQTVATPLIGEGLLRLFRDLRGARLRVYAAVWLCLTTHALLDALTVYGTRLLWPLWPEPIGVGSVFIIDPLYTLPLLAVVAWAVCLRDWTARFRTVLTTGLALSTAYLGWSLVAQQLALARAGTALARLGTAPAERLLATPTPLNTLLWRVIAIDGDRYLNLYVPLLGGDAAVTAYAHPRGIADARCLDGVPAGHRLARFSHGFYRLDREADAVVLSDLRMGLTPNYAFRFAVAEIDGIGLRAVPAERRRGARTAPGDVGWLLAGIAGRAATRPAEADALVAPGVDPGGVRLAALSCDPTARTGATGLGPRLRLGAGG